MSNCSKLSHALVTGAAMVMLAASGVIANVPNDASARSAPHVLTRPAPGVVETGAQQQPGPASEKTAALNASAAWLGFANEAGGDWSVSWNTLGETPHLATGRAFALPGVSRLTADNVVPACLSFVDSHMSLFKIKPSQLRLQSATNAGGRWYTTFQQTCNGVPVFGSRLTMSFTKDDRLIMFGSDVYPNVAVDTTPKVDAKTAARIARQDCLETAGRDQVSEPELLVVPEQTAAGMGYTLCWKLEILQPDAHAKWQYFIDAATGSITGKTNVLRYADVTGTVQCQYVPEFPNDPTRLVAPCRHARVQAQGPEVVIGSWDFNTNPGWSTQGQWAFGVPTGHGGTSYGYPDPASGHTGSNVYGVNLNGDYSATPGGPYYLTTGAMNCSGKSSIWLRFYRWLNSDYDPFVICKVQVSNNGSTWTSIWGNTTGEIVDSSWNLCSYDISSVAANQPTVYVRWSYQVSSMSGVWQYSGWNIDDVSVVSVTGGISSCYAEADGSYAVTPPWDPCGITSKLEGRYCDINYGGGSDSQFAQNGMHPGDIVNWTWDPSLYHRIDESSIYYHTNFMHDWYKALDPAFSLLDYSMPVTAYVPNFANAYWDGTGMTFGGGDGVNYGNFGLSSEVVYHEYTHGVTDKMYGGTSIPDYNVFGAMHEGFSDYFGCALSLSQSPIMGDGGLVIGNPNGMRTLNNHYRWETDWYGEVHYDSQMFSGSLFEARQAVGGAVMDKLAHFARYAYATNYEDYLLALLAEDDTRYGDNNLSNGTPHGQAIHTGFGNHGIGGLRYSPPGMLFAEATGNGNGKLDPGETGSMSLTLTNGWANATNVHATLTTTDPFVVITKASASFPDVSFGANSSNSADAFGISVLPSCPTTHTVNFTLTITADGPYSYSRTSLFYALVAVDQLAYDDGGSELPAAINAQDALAVRFTPDSYPFYPTQIRLFAESSFTPALTIWDDDGTGGGPGTVLGTIGGGSATTGAWNDVDMNSLGICIQSGSVYVGWVGAGSPYFYAGYDLDPPGSQRTVYYQKSANKWYVQPNNAMIRLRYANWNIASVKNSADGATVTLLPGTVSAAFPDFLYIESDDRTSGIRVNKPAHGVAAGTRVRVNGALQTATNGERCIAGTAITPTGTGSVTPLLVTNNALGGGPLGRQDGLWSWRWVSQPEGPVYQCVPCSGLNNIGLLVRTCGKVTAWGRGWFYIDDGSRVDDGTGIRGVYVRAPGLTEPSLGSYLSVTGASSCEFYDGKLVDVLLPRSQSDVVVLEAGPPGGETHSAFAAEAADPRSK